MNLVSSIDTEIVDISLSAGRILAQPLASQLDFPHWDNSAMDGYAVRFTDVETCTPEQPAILKVVETIAAGSQPQLVIHPGEAARIFTGACLPLGADTIVMQEQAQLQDEDRVAILNSPSVLGEFVRHRASFYQAGNTLLESGTLIKAPEIAILAAAQCQQLTVFRRPRVVVFSTGDELVSIGQSLQPGQIVDSNHYALMVFAAQAGAIPTYLGIVKDEEKATKNMVAQAIAKADIVLSSGGVSVGEHDYVEKVLEALGAEIHIRSVAVKPGKPLTVATFPQLPHQPIYFGLPGNPVSALVSCWRFVAPALKKLSGIKDNWKPEFIKARSQHNLRSDGKRETYLWGKLDLVAGNYEFSLAGGSQNSGNLINLAQTTGLAMLPVGKTSISQGEEVEVLKI
ncbi:molybdopterin molybdenumtransferase [Merismopedia glauca CCAP 1448/3]|uniref:Molybdopterin molybdenumtransferase n=2 Tax=Merismopedia TaxID=53402 RepID=A0A2T1C419_9CYAN|nr:gephyrin-like molybdotransferase Glp [Merismopedia glauca]PSB03025.1 molybdopterin molybdenumtransferase [Merismopedia glauca CCAP 1448/3]